MGAVLHRVTAVVVTLVLALGGPASLPRSCDRCPTTCPMHRVGSAGGHPAGCHHGPTASSDDGSALKCACGHPHVATPAATEYGLPPRTVSVGPALVAGLQPEVPAVEGGRAAPEPPAEPPRRRVV